MSHPLHVSPSPSHYAKEHVAVEDTYQCLVRLYHVPPTCYSIWSLAVMSPSLPTSTSKPRRGQLRLSFDPSWPAHPVLAIFYRDEILNHDTKNLLLLICSPVLDKCHENKPAHCWNYCIFTASACLLSTSGFVHIVTRYTVIILHSILFQFQLILFFCVPV